MMVCSHMATTLLMSPAIIAYMEKLLQEDLFIYNYCFVCLQTQMSVPQKMVDVITHAPTQLDLTDAFVMMGTKGTGPIVVLVLYCILFLL